MVDGRVEDERALWEGLEGGVVWTRIEKGRGKVECALMVSSVGRNIWARMARIKNSVSEN